MLPPPRTRVSAKQRRAREAATKAVAVLRVSTQAQEASGLGLSAQVEAIESFAARVGLELVATFTDTASGKTPPSERAGMAAALALLATAQAGVLIAARPDRLTRVTSDLYQLMDLSARQGWCIRTTDGVVDTCTENGLQMARVAGLFAEQERRLISSRTSAALQAKKAQGHRLGRKVTTPPATRQRIRDLRLAGTTMQEIAAILNAEGVTTVNGRPWSWQNIQRTISSLQLDDRAHRIGGDDDADIVRWPQRRHGSP